MFKKLSERALTLGGKDTKAIEKDRKYAEREERLEKQKRKYEEERKEEEERQKNALHDLNAVLGEDDESEMEATDDGAYTPPTTRQKMAAPPPLHVPRNILLREAVQVAASFALTLASFIKKPDRIASKNLQVAMTRNKISPQSMVDMFCALVKESGGNVADYFINAGNVGEKRNTTAQNSLAQEKQEWTPPDPAVR